MNARLIGTGALIAIALTIVPDKDIPVRPVVQAGPESVLCDKATAETVYPDTLVNRVVAGYDCATRYAADTIHRVTRDLGMGER